MVAGLPDQRHSLTPEIRYGSRVLEGIKGLEILGDFVWSRNHNAWIMRCRLTRAGPSAELVPRVTDWFLHVAAIYPAGPIKLFPADKNGLTATFPHQRFNEPSEEPWRTGNICVDTDLARLRRYGLDQEPRNADNRLEWQILRALRWLQLASTGDLHQPGDPFELPQYPSRSGTTLAFSESALSLRIWDRRSERHGLAKIRTLDGPTAVVFSFETESGESIYIPEFGKVLKSEDPPETAAAWIRIDQVPVLEPWQAASTWGELHRLLESQSVDLKKLLRLLLPHLRVPQKPRQKSSLRFLLLGFPIPGEYGGELQRMHWLGIELPKLFPANKPAQGFRNNESGRWIKDQPKICGSAPVRWLRSESWEPTELSARGRLPSTLVDYRVLLLGAGALGSVVAELLARGGVQNIVIVDPDVLRAGNLVRHTLTLVDLEKSKAEALASRLNRSSPHTRAVAVAQAFPEVSEEQKQLCEASDLVIDCTANDDVLGHLRKYLWPGSRIFASISLSFRAQRLFCFATSGRTFPSEAYFRLLEPWIARDRSEFRAHPLSREGLGCWHPLFPARIDDIWMLAATAIKYLEQAVASDLIHSKLVVFEQFRANGQFLGVQRIEGGPPDAGP